MAHNWFEFLYNDISLNNIVVFLTNVFIIVEINPKTQFAKLCANSEVFVKPKPRLTKIRSSIKIYQTSNAPLFESVI